MKPPRRITLILTVLLAVTIVLILLAGARNEEHILGEPDWQPLFRGVDLWKIVLQDPWDLRIYIARVNLDEQGVRPLVTPGNGPDPGETDAYRTTSFARQYGVQLAVNGDFFSPFPIALEATPCDVAGPARSTDGRTYSPDDTRPAIVFESGRAGIVEPPAPLDGPHQLLGGWPILVRDGRKRHRLDLLRAPRTALGLDESGRTLYIIVVDGRRPGISEGVRLPMLADICSEIGCYQALNLDGGGSTTLVVCSGPDRECGILNSPSGHQGEGGERIVANHLGIYALDLE